VVLFLLGWVTQAIIGHDGAPVRDIQVRCLAAPVGEDVEDFTSEQRQPAGGYMAAVLIAT